MRTLFAPTSSNSFPAAALWSANSFCFISLFLLPAGDRLRLGQQVAELGVVHLHPVIEVEADLLVGGVLQLLLEGGEFGLLLEEVALLPLEFVAVAGAGRLRLVPFKLFDPGGEFALERDDV